MAQEEKLAPLGFGFMRLPTMKNDEGKTVVNLEETKVMVDLFMNAGFNYFDTARNYHVGKSEAALCETLVERYPRDSFTIASKLPAWMARDVDHAHAMFEKSLRETGAGFFDYFLLHNLGGAHTQVFEDFDLWNHLLQKKADGLIRNLGFSIHDDADALTEVLKAHAQDVDFVQLQINWADWEDSAVQSRRCYEIAREHDLPIVIMEPIKGGTLVKLPPAVAEVFQAAEPDTPLASWALRFAASLPGVKAVLSGMSTPEQVEQNVAIMRDGAPLTPAEYAVIDQARAVLDENPGIPCTGCRYCEKDCPEGVHIPAILQSLNIADQFGDMHRAKENYSWNASGGPASQCVGCGTCEDLCPQHIGIVEEMQRATEIFD